MALNYCTPLFEDADRITGTATAAVTGKRFLDITATPDSGPGLNSSVEGGNIRVAPAAAGAAPIGVAAYDAPAGADVNVISQPGIIVPITAAGSIAAGDEVEVGPGGRATAFGTGIKAGKAVSTATDGTDVFVKLY